MLYSMNDNLAITTANILAGSSVWCALWGDSLWGQNWGYLKGHRQKETLNRFSYKTQLFCGLRPKIGISDTEVFVAGNFVTRSQRRQMEMVFTGCLAWGIFSCSGILPMLHYLSPALLISLWKSSSDTQPFIVSFLGYQWLSVFHLWVSGVKFRSALVLHWQRLELVIVLLSPEEHCILFFQ